MKPNFVFKSSDHLRYENSRHVSGPYGGQDEQLKLNLTLAGTKVIR